jgi:membrane dipeptidase
MVSPLNDADVGFLHLRHGMRYLGPVRRFSCMSALVAVVTSWVACQTRSPAALESAERSEARSSTVNATSSSPLPIATLAATSAVPTSSTLATDWAEPSSPSQRGFLTATDLHVDLGWQIHAKKASLSDASRQASIQALRAAQVGTLVVSMFVEKAAERPAAEVAKEYDATLRDVQAAFASEGARDLLGAPFAKPESGKIRIRISFEGADGFADSPELARAWLKRGACLWGLVHNKNNALGGASQDPRGESQGLTDRGAALAHSLVAGGGVLDLAHASDRTSEDLVSIARTANAPIVATHTGMRALHNIRRNLPDDLIRKVAASGGIVGVSFYVGHLTAKREATLDDVILHVEHLRAIGGTKVLALGSDYEGGITPPKDAQQISSLPKLAAKLRSRGFSEPELEAFFHGNADRVFAWAESHGCGR